MIDRSAVATARAARRNATHLAAGRIAVRQTTLAGLAAPAYTFDKALAINVNLFWVSDPAAELTVLKHALRPGAPLHILYGADGPPAPAGLPSRSP